MKKMYQEGVISKEVLFLYGISGPLPEIETYKDLSSRNKAKLWGERLERRLGLNWRSHYNFIAQMIGSNDVNWVEEGF